MPGSGHRAIPAPDPRKALSWGARSPCAALRFDELSELFEFQPRPTRRHPRGRTPSTLALGEQLLRYHCCVALDFRFVLRERADRVVQQVSTQTARLSFEAQGRMDHSGEARFVPTI